MRVLFDNGTPRGVASALSAHIVEETRARGAEAAGFDIFVTTDRNIRYQQNLTGRRIAVVVLGRGRWRLIKSKLHEIANAIAALGREQPVVRFASQVGLDGRDRARRLGAARSKESARRQASSTLAPATSRPWWDSSTARLRRARQRSTRPPRCRPARRPLRHVGHVVVEQAVVHVRDRKRHRRSGRSRLRFPFR